MARGGICLNFIEGHLRPFHPCEDGRHGWLRQLGHARRNGKRFQGGLGRQLLGKVVGLGIGG